MVNRLYVLNSSILQFNDQPASFPSLNAVGAVIQANMPAIASVEEAVQRLMSEFLVSDTKREELLHVVHQSFGHVNAKTLLKTLSEMGLDLKFSKGDRETLDNCIICGIIKSKRKPVAQSESRAVRLLEKIHADPFYLKRKSKRGRYALLIVDEFSRFAVVHITNTTAKVPDLMKHQIADWEYDHAPLRVRHLRCDNGELAKPHFVTWCSERFPSIQCEPSPSYRQSFNGMAERLVLTMRNLTALFLYQANLPWSFETFAVEHAIFVYNNSVHSTTKCIPSVQFTGRSAAVTSFHPFGCLVIFYLDKKQRDDKACNGRTGIFLGNAGSTLYWVWDMSRNRRIKVYDVRVYPSLFPYHEQTIVKRPTGIPHFSHNPDLEDDQSPSEDSNSSSSSTDSDEVDVPGNSAEDSHLSEQAIEASAIGDDDHIWVEIETNALVVSSYDHNAPLSGLFYEDLATLCMAETTSDQGESDQLDQPIEQTPVTPTCQPTALNVATLCTAQLTVRTQATLNTFQHETINLAWTLSQAPKLPLPGGFQSHRPRSENFHWPSFIRSNYPLKAGMRLPISQLPPVPRNLKEAMCTPLAPEFLAAMFEEVNSLVTNHTYVVQEKPEDRKLIGTRWVFDYKSTPDGTLERIKARLVAQGFSQVEGVDYDETFSPVMSHFALRFTLAVGLLLDMVVEVMDVDSAFLQGYMKHEAFIRLPQGFEHFSKSGKPMCGRLLKALYGLKQSARLWFDTLIAHFAASGYEKCKGEPCMYMHRTKDNELLIILVWVDDIVAAATKAHVITEFKSKLKTAFPIKELGQVNWLLRIQIERTADQLWFGQPTRTRCILEELHLWDVPESMFAHVPMRKSWKYDPISPLLDEQRKTHYRSILMKISYLAITTRPDISLCVNVMSQFQGRPSEQLWKDLLHLMLYLRGTVDYGLLYVKSNEHTIVFDSEECAVEGEGAVTAYADASFAEEEDRKSRSGLVLMVCGCAVNWSSRKQGLVTLSSTEAEYVSLADCVREGKAMLNFLKESGFVLKNPMTINQDNKSTIHIATNPMQYSRRTKHIDLKLRFVEEIVSKKEVKLVYCPTEHMVADILTKPLARGQFEYLRTMLGVRNISDLGSKSLNMCWSMVPITGGV